MDKRVIFYNHFGNGDIFESREFVKEYMEKIPADEYYYAHGKPQRILADIPELKFTEVTDVMNGMHAAVITDDTLYINTWIGRDGKYVLPGIGCVVENLYRMHNEILNALKFEPLQKEMVEYIPSLDYSYYETDKIDAFCQKYDNRKILISNGPVQSNQAKNFDFTKPIKMVAQTFPDILFLVTSPADIKADNVFFTSDIIQTEDGFDLNEISYLSMFCDTHIGRNSGPHVFAQVRENWNDHNKVTLSFTYTKMASHFVYKLPTAMEKRWSDATEEFEVYHAMAQTIRRAL
jgi:hypothetical protein